MRTATQKVFDWLWGSYKEMPDSKKSALCSIFQSFKDCSWYTDEKSGVKCYLVQSSIKAINFDILTEWLCQGVTTMSADSMAFTQSYIYLIEFKSGNQVKGNLTAQDLKANITGKINSSDDTIFNKILPNVKYLNRDNVKLRFCLVVDIVAMGIKPQANLWAQLSVGKNKKQNQYINTLKNKIMPNLQKGIRNKSHFDKTEIWYSEVFDKHLEAHEIKDIEEMLRGRR